MSEFDSAGTLAKSLPKSLAAFLAAGEERARLWQPEELGAIFRHQMAAPILVDLGGFDAATAARLKTLSQAQNLVLKSFLDLFLHPVPPVELLTLTKEFAKGNMDQPDSSLPNDVAAVLYYLSIAAAYVRLGRRISQLGDAEFKRGLEWSKGKPWVETRLQHLLDEALQQLAQDGPQNMSKESSKQEAEAFVPPVSVFAGPIAELVGHRLLSPPNRPGLLATLARYEVLRVLGGGGMGVVLLARDSESGRDVALKMVRPELVPNQQVVHRFVKEAGHLQKLKHPHIVPVLEISDRPQGPYFVMPYFEQGSLAQRIRPGQGLDASVTLDIATQVAEGLQFAHQRGIIHRDLKPANILLGANQQTCLADFGLARTMFNDTIVDVERDQMEGTAPYMSPGVAAGHAEDTRCDIYAFGALLYEMLTGEPPYAGRNTQDIRQQILAGPPRPIRQRNPEAGAGLTAVAEGAMARELRNRYADMTDVLADLTRIKQGRAPAGPHGLVSRVRHIPWTVWIPAGVVLVVLCWLVWHPAAPPTPVANAPVTNALPPPVVIKQTAATNPAPAPAPPPKQIVVAPQFSPPIVVGSLGVTGSSDGVAAQARFCSPGAIAVDSAGYIYVADMGNDTIRKISPSGSVSTLAGRAGKAGKTDGYGAEARFTAPSGIAVAGSGNVYVAEFASDTIRKISPEGLVTLLAGSPGIPGWKDDKGDNAHFRNPWSVAVDRSENVYVVDKDNFVIRKITPDGSVTTVAGKPGVPGFADGQGEAARFQDSQGIAVDATGNIYVADTGNQVVRKISPSGEVTSIAFGLIRPDSVAVSGKGTVYVADLRGVSRVSNGKAESLPPLMLTANPDGPLAQADNIALDSRGTIYVVDSGRDIVCWRPGK